MRKLLYSDKKAIFEYAKNPEVAKHVLWYEHKSEFDTLEFLNTVYEAYNKNKAAPWGIELKANNKLIGTAGFVGWDKNSFEAEIGYTLSQDYWNMGITTEAVKKIINFGFEKMQLTKILSRCKPSNVASYKVLEKVGFTFGGIVKDQMIIKGKYEDMRMYYYSAIDYFSRKEKLNA